MVSLINLKKNYTFNLILTVINYNKESCNSKRSRNKKFSMTNLSLINLGITSLLEICLI